MNETLNLSDMNDSLDEISCTDIPVTYTALE